MCTQPLQFLVVLGLARQELCHLSYGTNHYYFKSATCISLTLNPSWFHALGFILNREFFKVLGWGEVICSLRPNGDFLEDSDVAISRAEEEST
jgi:hypothetical protein